MAVAYAIEILWKLLIIGHVTVRQALFITSCRLTRIYGWRLCLRAALVVSAKSLKISLASPVAAARGASRPQSVCRPPRPLDLRGTPHKDRAAHRQRAHTPAQMPHPSRRYAPEPVRESSAPHWAPRGTSAQPGPPPSSPGQP